MNRRVLRGVLAALLLGSSAAALAAEGPPICTDRPGKGNAVCTVPEGKLQLETTLADWTRIESGGDEPEVWVLGSSFLKLGLSDRSDMEIGITPYLHVETETGGGKSRASGFGDVTVRYKHRLTGDGAKVEVAAIPFVKLPTADRDIGNGKVEGGLAIPVSIAVGSVSVTLSPEADLLADADDHGRHFALTNLIGLSGPVAPGVTLVGELWTTTNFDPADTVTLVSADAGVAYLVSDSFQFDLGANLGLNRNTPDVELYAGFAIRF